MKRAALLARISREDSNTERLEAQLDACRKWAEENDYLVPTEHVYAEDGVSGGLPCRERPILMRALEALKEGRVRTLVLRDLDRLGRRFDTAELIEEYAGYGEGINFVNQPRVNDPIAQAIITGTGALLARLERMMIAERTAAGRRRVLAQGRYAGGSYPFWLLWTGECWQLQEEEVPRLQELVRRYLAGEGADKLTRLFDGRPPGSLSRQHRSRAGTVTSNTEVLNILRNPALAGRLYRQPPVAAPGTRHREAQRKQVLKLVILASSLKEADDISLSHGLVAVEIPALVDWETFAKIQQVRRANFHAPMRDTSWLLQGRIRCGSCGRAYICKPSGGRNGRRWYRDGGRTRRRVGDGELCTMGPPLLADWIEARVEQRLVEVLDRPDLLRKTVEDYLQSVESRLQKLELQLAPVSDRIEELSKRRERLALLWAEGDLSDVRYRTERDRVARELGDLQGRTADIDQLRRELHNAQTTSTQLRRLRESPHLGRNVSAEIGAERERVVYGGRITMEGNEVVLYPRFYDRFELRDLLSFLDVRLTVCPNKIGFDAVISLDEIEGTGENTPQNCFGSRRLG